MRPLRIVRLVAARELRERARQKSFKLATAFLAAALIAVVLVPRLFDGAPPSYRIGLVAPASSLVTGAVAGLATATGAELAVADIADAGAGEARVASGGDLDVLVSEGEVVVDEAPDPSSALGQVAATLARTLGLGDALSNAGVAPEAAADVLGGAAVPVRSLQPAGLNGEDDPQPLLVVGVILLYLALLTFGVAVTTGVVEEKTSRVVEVLLSAIRPHHLLAGKVLGIGVLGLAQLTMVATPALVLAVATGTELPSGSAMTVASLVMWFILGYALYSCAYAAAGSLVSRMEEANNTSFPVTFVLVLAYGGAIFVGNAPDSTLARILALFPPTAPLAMPTRAAMGDAAAWEVLLAVGLTLVAIYGLVRLAGRVYAGSVLRFGPKVKLRQALR